MQSPATTNWLVPERHDLLRVLDAHVMEKADAPVSATSGPDDPISAGVPRRSELLLQEAINRVRYAIRHAGHTPLSVTANAVPPEAVIHVLNMAAWMLVRSTPNIQMVVFTERGAYAPLGDAHRQAEKYLEDIPKKGITEPTDPTGRDWTTAITWMDDVEEYTDEELQSLTWSWPEFSALGYTYEEWSALTNPPIRGTVISGGTNPPQDMSLTPAGSWPTNAQTELGSP